MSLNKGFLIFSGALQVKQKFSVGIGKLKKNFLSQEAPEENPEIYVNTKTVGAICGSGGRLLVKQREGLTGEKFDCFGNSK